jgi:hypothetical protein
MGASDLALLVLALDTGQPFDLGDLLRGESIRGIARFLPLPLLQNRLQELEVAPSAKLFQTALPLPHGSDADRPHLPDIAHRGGHLSRDVIEVDTEAALLSPQKSCHMVARPGWGARMARRIRGPTLPIWQTAIVPNPAAFTMIS